MTKRNVLVIAYYFPPMGLSGVQRTLKFVKYLPENGWSPIVLTTADESYYAYDDTLLGEINLDEVKVYRTEGVNLEQKSKFPSYFIQRLGQIVIQTFRQPDSKIKWKKHALELAEKIISENDISVIYATAPPYTDFLIGEELSKKHDIPLVIDYRDTWVDNPFNFYATPLHKNYSITLEKNVLKEAEKSIVISRYAKEILLKRYRFLSHNDIAIIPHGFDPADFANKSNISKKSSKFILTHSGMFQDNRTPKYFFKAIQNLIKAKKINSDKIEVRLLGLMRKNHIKLISKYELDSVVTVCGNLNHKEVIDELLSSNVLWLWMNDTIRTPGKIYEYFGARKPIIAALPDGFIRSLAEESGNALTCNPKDVKAIESAILEYYNLWQKGKLKETDLNFVNKFDRRELTAELSKQLSLITRY